MKWILVAALLACTRASGATELNTVLLSGDGHRFRIDPKTLAVQDAADGRIIASPVDLGPVEVDGPVGSKTLTLHYPARALRVMMELAAGQLQVRFETTQEQTVRWPVFGQDPRATALVYPDGDGLYVPVTDPFWLEQFREPNCLSTHGDLAAPFWGVQFQGNSVTYVLPTDLQSRFCVASQSGRLGGYVEHDFRTRDGLPDFAVTVSLTGGAPLAPALAYRLWLQEQGRLTMLAAKIKQTPAAARLLGATHAYLWGDGRTLPMLDDLAKLGLGHLWLGYDQDPRTSRHLVTPKFIAQAKSQGYLIGPYDIFQNAQDPDQINSTSSDWGATLFKNGCIVKADGQVQAGFHGLGCELSSAALKRSPPPFDVATRVRSHLQMGVNSYFLDVDAYGDLYDDYSPDHPMTPAVDRANRLERMRYISQTKDLVLGSERNAAWSNDVTHFSHGTYAVHNQVLWPLQSDTKVFGGWWPEERPEIFFKRVGVSDDFRRAKYDPTYRLPLFQAVFHGALITTERWELSPVKFKDLYQVRMLLELLHNVPSVWSLDRQELRTFGPYIQAHDRFFSPLHQLIGSQPLTAFAWLTADRLVQRTQFGNEVALTANFRTAPYAGLAPRCIRADWLKQGRQATYCPATL